MRSNDIILAPIITEKSMKDAKSNKFAFRVSMGADKKSLKKAIEEKFKVDVLGVWTMIVKGRKIRVGRKRNEVSLSPWKKAIVKVKEGQKIGLFDMGKK